MPNYDQAGPQQLNRSRLAAAGLVVVGLLLAIVVTALTLVRLWELGTRAQPPPVASEFVGAAGLLLAGWAAALLLWSLAELIRRVDELLAHLRAGGPQQAASATPAASQVRPPEGQQDTPAQLLEELVQLTRELRDIELLSEPERAARSKAEAEALVRKLEQEIPALLREHNLQEAHQRLARARQRFPFLPAWDVLEHQIESARAKFESHDLQAATREVDDLMALGAWDRAVEVVRTLRQRHPRSEQVAELTRRVLIARDKATAEERARLMSQAQAATNRRDWSEALRLVEAVISRFPGSPEAQELRLQLPTLRANAEVQKRQRMENQIRDLIRQQRFGEALRIATELVTQYPESPQAQVLRDQIPRLEQKAAELAQLQP